MLSIAIAIIHDLSGSFFRAAKTLHTPEIQDELRLRSTVSASGLKRLIERVGKYQLLNVELLIITSIRITGRDASLPTVLGFPVFRSAAKYIRHAA